MTGELNLVQVLEIDLDFCDNDYGVAPCTAAGAAGTECYNTFVGCQDKANFVKISKTYRFCSRGAPIPLGEELRPLIESVSQSPTAIDPEKGLAKRGQIKVTMRDEPATDVGTDPYLTTRAAAGGSWFGRLLARNPNAVGRQARLRTAYLTDGWDWSKFVTERFLIESMVGPDANGRVVAILKDTLKLCDRAKLPEPSNGKLLLELIETDLSLTMNAGEGADYATSGTVRVGKELIGYTGKAGDVLSWPDLTYRGQFGTTAGKGSVGGNVQACLTYDDVPATEVLQDLLELSGIDTALIDVAGFAEEESTWLGPVFNVTAALSAPAEACVYLAELTTLLRGFIWWSPTEQLVKFKVLAPPAPDEPALSTLDQIQNWIHGSIKVKPQDGLRVTGRALFYNLSSATADLKEPSSYLDGDVTIDTDASGANEYNDTRIGVVFSRWWSAKNAVAAQALNGRAVAYLRDAPVDIAGQVDPQDQALREGDLVDVTLPQITDLDGNPKTTRCLILRRLDRGGKIDLLVRTTGLGQRWAFIAPDTAGDYPADPEWLHIAPDATGFADGSPPYIVY